MRIFKNFPHNNLSPERSEVLLHIDKRAPSFKVWLNEAFALDERYARYVTQSDLTQENIAAKIDENIQRHLC